MLRIAAAAVISILAAFPASLAVAQDGVPPKVHVVWMGGNDCPPCKAWRAVELPKLQASPEYRGITFSYVSKTIPSPVPATVFLPEAVKPFKGVLDAASGGHRGSPQAAILVDGVVYDYFWGTRDANEIEKMLAAIRTGTPWNGTRCLKWYPPGPNRGCQDSRTGL